MKAVVFVGPGKVAVADVDEPRLEAEDDALVAVGLTGICGTDLHLVRGHEPGMTARTRLGHELVGRVIAVGPAVRRVAVGDRVMASDFTACGHCRWCTRGDHWECAGRAFFGTGAAYGSVLVGVQAERARIPHADTTLARVPAGMTDEAALLVGDNLATGWVAIDRARVAPGECVVVIGGGAVGQLTSLSAQTVGAGAVVVVEPNAGRRAFAERHGALAAAPDAADALVRQLTDGDGADVVIDAVGGARPFALALALVRRRGRIVSVGAHGPEPFPLPMARAFADELTVSFAIGDAIRERDLLARLIGRKVLDPAVVVDGRFPLAEAEHAYAEAAAQRYLKVVLTAGG